MQGFCKPQSTVQFCSVAPNMKYYLFLDDVRTPNDVVWKNLPQLDWKIVRNYNDFVKIINENGIPSFISYDHDLAYGHYEKYHGVDEEGRLIINYDEFEEKTGYDCCKFLVSECMKLKLEHPDFIVHSLNPIGAKNISLYIENYNKTLK